MSKTLSSPLVTATGKKRTRPLHFIEITASPIQRLCTFGTLTWNGQSWSGAQSVTVSGLSENGRGSKSPTLTISNFDDAYGAMALADALTNKPVKIWTSDAAATADADPVLEFTGFIASAEVGLDFVVFPLTSQSPGKQLALRRFINRASGFNTLMPAGKEIRIGNTIYVLERA